MSRTTVRTIDIEEWKAWHSAGHAAQIVDVRSPTEYASGHVPGAINIPLEQVETRTADLGTDRSVILVCQAGTRARMAAELLCTRGLDLVVLEGGTEAWQRGGNATVRCTATRWALERQVRLVAGLLVAAGVVLGVAVSRWWLVVPAIVGCGLTFAGITNLCPMGEALARLPWNRKRRSSAGASTAPQTISCGCEGPERR